MRNDIKQESRESDSSGLSRRQLLNRAMIAAAGGFALLGMATPAYAKMTPQAAGYQASSKTSQKCSGCALFKAPSSCNLVDGDISPDGWCRLFTQKSS